jgi:hypothetical protein
MASKAKAATSGSGTKLSKTAAKLAREDARKLKAEPKRAEQRGRRTTLRVPLELKAEVARVAEELEVSENDALIRLAQIGAVTAKRRRDVRKVIGKRHAAVSAGASRTKKRTLPTAEEMQEAILVDRD